MGAECTKLEPPAPAGHASADPMAVYCAQAYAQMHEGVRVLQAHLKTPEGQAVLHAELERSDVLITSFAPRPWPSSAWAGMRCRRATRACRWCASSALRARAPKRPGMT